MQTQQNVPVSSLVLGAALVVVGFVLGSISQSRPAHAQTVVDEKLTPFAVAGTTLITSSDDGTTLHFWSQAPAGTDSVIAARGFHYQGSRSK